LHSAHTGNRTIQVLSSAGRELRALAVILYTFLSYVACAQQLNFETIASEEGLPQTTVYGIYQDVNGYLWIGTDGGGLSRYDGYRVRNFGRNEGLKANVIRDITADSSGTLWLATNGGLYFSDGARYVSANADWSQTYFSCVYVDSKQRIWAGTMGDGIYQLARNDTGFVISHLGISDGLGSAHIFDICENASGQVCIASFGSGIDVYDPTDQKIRTYRIPGLEQVISLFSHGDDLFAGTRGNGGYRLNISGSTNPKAIGFAGTEGQTVWSFAANGRGDVFAATDQNGVVSALGVHLSQSGGLPNNYIVRLLVDRENNLWIGTNGSGLCKWLGRMFTHITSKEVAGLSHVTAVSPSGGGSYWIGTRQSGAFLLAIEGGKLKSHKNLTTGSGLPSPAVTAITHGKDGRVWFGTRNGVAAYDGESVKRYDLRSGLVDSVVNALHVDRRGQVWIGTSGGLSILGSDGRFTNISEANGLLNNEVQSVVEDHDGAVWIGTFGGVVKSAGTKLYGFFEEDGLTEKKVQCLAVGPRNEIYAGTFGGGIFVSRPSASGHAHRFELFCDDEILASNNISSLVFESDSVMLATSNRGLDRIRIGSGGKVTAVAHFGKKSGFSGAEINQNAAGSDPANGLALYGSDQGITTFDHSELRHPAVAPSIRVTSFRVNGVQVPVSGKLKLSYKENSVTADFVSISLSNPSGNKYFARLAGLEEEWNRLAIDPQFNDAFIRVNYRNLQPGTYTLQLRSVSAGGVPSEQTQIPFFIAKPYYRTGWFIAACILTGFAITFLFFRLRERQLRHDKIRLEAIVEKRTAEVVESRKKIEAQKDMLQLQKMEITDSINYSKRIQNAILPGTNLLSDNFPASFILYLPKDIVSGDFYFFEQVKNRFYLAVADCTGHGVPGAFMSLLGSKELAEAVSEGDDPGKVLGTLNRSLKHTLKQNDETLGIRDGMDIALLMAERGPNGDFDLYFSGANRPLWIVRKDRLTVDEVKPTKTAIGGFTSDAQPFESVKLQLEEGDSVYLFSDGYADQFGGASGKKMMTRRFKEILVANSGLAMDVQKDKLQVFFESWKGTGNAQVDDVLVIGLKI
jgi:ligand-binding sensor domain-containing protein/serine phosphatase RsbU (regulator of sigma subunit)